MVKKLLVFLQAFVMLHCHYILYCLLSFSAVQCPVLDLVFGQVTPNQPQYQTFSSTVYVQCQLGYFIPYLSPGISSGELPQTTTRRVTSSNISCSENGDWMFEDETRIDEQQIEGLCQREYKYHQSFLLSMFSIVAAGICNVWRHSWNLKVRFA